MLRNTPVVKLKHVVTFAKVDGAKVAFNGHYALWNDAVFDEFIKCSTLRHAVRESALVRHAVHEYKSPLRYLDEVEIQMFIESVNDRSFVVGYVGKKLEEEIYVSRLVYVSVDSQRKHVTISSDLR